MRRTVGASRIGWALLLAMLVIGRPVVADEAPTLTTRLAEADRLLAAGELRQAQSVLEVLQAQLPPEAPPEQRAAVSARLGAVLGETGEDERALALLQEAVELASSSAAAGAAGRSAQRPGQCAAARRCARGVGFLSGERDAGRGGPAAKAARACAGQRGASRDARRRGRSRGRVAAAGVRPPGHDAGRSGRLPGTVGRRRSGARAGPPRPRLSGAGRSPAAPGPDIERGIRRPARA